MGRPVGSLGKNNIASRFWECVEETAEGCWEWVRGADPLGYGRVYVNGKVILSHRHAYNLYYGRVALKEVLHHCDNPKCCNPLHLWEGDQQENLTDMQNKHRGTCGVRNRHAVLSDEEVLAIRTDTRFQWQIAQDYGVTQPMISMIKSGKNWRHI